MAAAASGAQHAARATIVRSGLLRTQIKERNVRQAPSLFFMPGLKATPWWDGSEWPWVRALEANTGTILAEYRALRQARKVESDYELVAGEHSLHKGDWLWHSFVQKGKWNPAMQAACPETTRLLKEVPDLMTATPFSYAFFSTLEPGSRIAPHFGPCNLRVRCHLPLTVPKGADVDACGIRVAHEARSWRPGSALLFDDSYEHETWNDSAEPRVVLLVDVWHPDVVSGGEGGPSWICLVRKWVCFLFISC